MTNDNIISKKNEKLSNADEIKKYSLFIDKKNPDHCKLIALSILQLDNTSTIDTLEFISKNCKDNYPYIQKAMKDIRNVMAERSLIYGDDSIDEVIKSKHSIFDGLSISTDTSLIKKAAILMDTRNTGECEKVALAIANNLSHDKMKETLAFISENCKDNYPSIQMEMKKMMLIKLNDNLDKISSIASNILIINVNMLKKSVLLLNEKNPDECRLIAKNILLLKDPDKTIDLLNYISNNCKEKYPFIQKAMKEVQKNSSIQSKDETENTINNELRTIKEKIFDKIVTSENTNLIKNAILLMNKNVPGEVKAIALKISSSDVKQEMMEFINKFCKDNAPYINNAIKKIHQESLGYKHANLSPKNNRWHAFGFKDNINTLPYNNLDGDQLKTTILVKLKNKVDEAPNLVKLIEIKNEFKNDIDILKTGQGIATRVFSLKTDSIKAFEKFFNEKRKAFVDQAIGIINKNRRINDIAKKILEMDKDERHEIIKAVSEYCKNDNNYLPLRKALKTFATDAIIKQRSCKLNKSEINIDIDIDISFIKNLVMLIDKNDHVECGLIANTILRLSADKMVETLEFISKNCKENYPYIQRAINDIRKTVIERATYVIIHPDSITAVSDIKDAIFKDIKTSDDKNLIKKAALYMDKKNPEHVNIIASKIRNLTDTKKEVMKFVNEFCKDNAQSITKALLILEKEKGKERSASNEKSPIPTTNHFK